MAYILALQLVKLWHNNKINTLCIYYTRNAHAHVMVFDACAPNCDCYLRKLPWPTIFLNVTPRKLSVTNDIPKAWHHVRTYAWAEMWTRISCLALMRSATILYLCLMLELVFLWFFFRGFTSVFFLLVDVRQHLPKFAWPLHACASSSLLYWW